MHSNVGPEAATLPARLRAYAGAKLPSDLVAATIVAIMLVPQSLAYATVAGLPPQMGLYASVLPLIAYAMLGTSSSLAVGPVAIVSLLSASAVGREAALGSDAFISASTVLAAMVGVVLLALGVLRLGFLVNILSKPVLSAFNIGAGVLIGLGQLGPLLGLESGGQTLWQIVRSLGTSIPQFDLWTAICGVGSLAALVILKRGLPRVLGMLSIRGVVLTMLARCGPVVVLVLAIVASLTLDLPLRGVSAVGAIPAGLPALALPAFDLAQMGRLALPAFLIAVIGYVSSISVAQALAAKRGEEIDPNRELLALGAANIASAVGGGFSVTGGFARSVVNHDAGAATPFAGVLTAIGIAVATVSVAPALSALPRATLAATILVVIASFLDGATFRLAWRYSKPDLVAMVATLVTGLAAGVEYGVLAGLIVCIVDLLRATSRPHATVIGRVPGTEHYRNINRHQVAVEADVLSLRVDESLYFANWRFVQRWILKQVLLVPATRYVVLQCSAVNRIDLTGPEGLKDLSRQLDSLGVGLHLSEVKGPVSDRLRSVGFEKIFAGRVFLTHFQAVSELAASPAKVHFEPIEGLAAGAGAVASTESNGGGGLQ